MSSEQDSLDAYLDVEEREAKAGKARLDSRNVRRLFHEMLGNPGPLVVGLVMVLLGTGASLAEPRLFGYAIDEAIVGRNTPLLTRLVAGLLLLICIRAGSVIAQGYFFEILGQRVTQNLRMKLYSQLQRLPLSIYDRNPAGRLLTRVTNDIASLNDMFAAGFVSMVSNILMVIGILTGLVLLNWKLGLIACSVVPFMIAASAYFSAKLKVAYRDSRSKLSALNAFFAENMMGMKVVHLFNRQRHQLDRFNRLNKWYSDAQVGTITVFALFQPTITFSAGLAMALVIWYGGLLTSKGTLSLGVLVAFFSYVQALFQPMREIADKWNIFLSGMASAERIFSILDWQAELSPGSDRAPSGNIPSLRGHVVFENVWFAYEGEHWVLRDFSVEIEPGMKVGIVGHTGAGKTTLIALLMRFYEPQRGRILIDGRDIRDYDKRALRASLGLVQQDVFLFSGSIEENIGVDRLEDRAYLDEALVSMGHQPGELALQERGSNLSLGQRQIISFARALAAKPRIWILDEATANMDSGSEIHLQNALERAAEGKTLLTIAHRLATVRRADLILVLHKGALVEQGRHEALVRRDGLYARLYRFQAVADSEMAQV